MNTIVKFKSTHNLYFEVADWFYNDFKRFRIGSIDGLWRSTSFSYDILAIKNESPGNGHLQDVFDWFENSCRRDERSLRVLEVWNKKFKAHLIQKRGFKYVGNGIVEKTF